MWFFIITLMVIGSFFCGMIVTGIIHKDDLVINETFLKELKVVTDALKNTSCSPQTIPDDNG